MTTIYRHSNSGQNLGALSYISAVHDEDLDGTDRLTVETEAVISKRDRLVWKDNAGVWHEHMCDNPSRSHVRGRAVTRCDCSNSISELYGVIAGGDVIKGTVGEVLSALLAGTRWEPGECSDFGIVEIESWHRNVRECIAELCELVGGELETSITVGSFKVERRLASILKERGGGTVQRQFSYGRNVSATYREVGADEVYTAVTGYGAKLDKDDAEKYAERVSVTVRSGADLTRWGVPMPDGSFAHNFTTYTDAACTSATFLTKQCQRILNSVSKPLVLYRFDIAEVDADMWKDVRLGSRVHCTDDSFGERMELIERVSHITRRLSGQISCIVSIGKRANPMVERFRSQEKVSRKATGNSARISSNAPVITGGDYTTGDYEIEIESSPVSLRIVTPPDKLDYIGGESITIAGIVAELLDVLGNTYTDSWYPDGLVYEDELQFDPARIEYDPSNRAAVEDPSLAEGELMFYGQEIFAPGHPIGRTTFENAEIVCYSWSNVGPGSWGVPDRDGFAYVVYKKNGGWEVGFTLYLAGTTGVSAAPGVQVYRYPDGSGTDEFDTPGDGSDFAHAISSMESSYIPVRVMYTRQDGVVLSDSYNVTVSEPPEEEEYDGDGSGGGGAR